ncbi:MAG: hypothetical protein LBK99_16910 [Opitutaceae bacterium]|jgi:hypothetical protein|nr:hypothetical protein [Opitutaceae bacterium]
MHGHPHDYALMKTLTVSRAKAGFSAIARQIIKTKKTVLVQTPAGCIEMIPYDVPACVPPAEKGAFQYSEEALRLANTFGETL